MHTAALFVLSRQVYVSVAAVPWVHAKYAERRTSQLGLSVQLLLQL